MLPVGSEVPSDTSIDYTAAEMLLEEMRVSSAGFIIDSVCER
jgi:hypothetical protein